MSATRNGHIDPSAFILEQACPDCDDEHYLIIATVGPDALWPQWGYCDECGAEHDLRTMPPVPRGDAAA